LEGEDEQENAEHERVGADPNGQHHGANQRLDYEQDAEDDRRDTTERKPPAAMIDIEGEGCAKHQHTGNDRPDRDQPSQRHNSDERPEESDHAGGDIDDSFEDQEAPALAASCGSDT